MLTEVFNPLKYMIKDIKKLESKIQSLKDKNKQLEWILAIAKLWMTREIKESIKKVSKRKISKFACDKKNNFALENLEEIITDKIRNYFWDFILMNISSSVIDNIVSAEVAYYNLKQNPNYDGFWVVSSYHKALDAIIEQFITKWFRKFAKKTGQIHLRKNDSLEKALHSVVNKWFILSLWRLFHILQIISNNEKSYDYINNFKDYLNKYFYLKDVLLNKEFLKIYSDILDTEILGKKRHSWSISFDETKRARQMLIWDLKDKNSLIYFFLSTQDMDY